MPTHASSFAKCISSSPASRVASRHKRASPVRQSREIASSAMQADVIELDDSFSDVINQDTGLFTIAGFGSLLSPTSARSTFPQLQNYRVGKLLNFRRVFAHTCTIFFERGIARPETLEISSLSVEPHAGAETVVALFEVEATPEAVQAFIHREHEFRFCGVQPVHLDGRPGIASLPAVACTRNTDEEYRRRRCPPELWREMYGRYGVERIWRDDLKPCRPYLRHCVLAAEKLGKHASENFLDQTFLGDRETTVRQHLAANPEIMQELPPPSLIGRYSG